MKKLLVSVGGVILIAVALVTLASKTTKVVHAQGQSWTTFGTITMYYTLWNTNGVMVNTSSPYVLNGCTQTSNNGYVVDPSNPGEQTQQATLLAAFLSGKQVQIGVQGCSAAGGNRPEIFAITVQP